MLWDIVEAESTVERKQSTLASHRIIYAPLGSDFEFIRAIKSAYFTFCSRNNCILITAAKKKKKKIE